MSQFDPLFTRFKSSIDAFTLPEKFTFPFYYEPHPLCVLAAEELQQDLLEQELSAQPDWQHDFGLTDTAQIKAVDQRDHAKPASSGTGKMFGVLLVKNSQNELGYLRAFSGKIADQNLLPGFVPPVFDMLSSDSFFRSELAEITQVSDTLKQKQNAPELQKLVQTLAQHSAQADEEIEAYRQITIAGRASRKQIRTFSEQQLDPQSLATVLDGLARESVAEKNQLKLLKQQWQERIALSKSAVDAQHQLIEELKETRKNLSNALQHKLFEQYQFLNALGETRDLNSIFTGVTALVPPAGAGECAAPKLLQYAFQHGFTPIAMAEFWWGQSPKSEVRQHKQFYPSCHSKCQPILGHMLQGLSVDDNPLEESWAQEKELELLYQDDAIVVVNKPSGLLSVPGKTIKDSAYTRLQAQFPDVEGPFVIHRLDMATSGILVFALTKRANKSLQKQFITRYVQKRYVALIEGEVESEEGEISLPLRGDPVDRPRQLVCDEHGKHAETHWQRIEIKSGRTKLYLYPRTGRTHQLRVHCAHHLGLNMPMVGDGLYGKKADRLHLHAEQLSFDHPYSNEPLLFQVDAEF